jgi:1,4-alpha-glucan branching enzyme
MLLASCASADDADTASDDGKEDGVGSSSSLGATVTATGVRFAVWAPNADTVAVQGDFNAWSETASPMTRGSDDVWTATIDGAIAGQEYVYVIRHGADTLYRTDPRARDVVSSVGNGLIVDPESYAWRTTGYQTPPWNEQVIYEMHIGTFNDAAGGAPGTWASAIAKLDHLKNLGVNMLEVLPPAEFPGDFSWGYNPAQLMAPESAYGTVDDAKRFVDEAHARGMGVIVDVVHNHWGPNDLDTWCFDGECYGAGGIYFYTDDRRESGWGPRPDYGRSQVRDLIVDSALMWLREYRCDGLRWDSTINIRTSAGRTNDEGWGVMRRVNDAVDATQPWKIMIAEDLQSDPNLTRRTGDGGAGFDSQWDAGFFHPIDDAIIAGDDGSRNMGAVAGAIGHVDHGSISTRVIYTESHDEVANGKQRIPEMIWPGNAGSYYSRKRSTLGAAVMLTSPGIPMLFEGQEILEDGYWADGDPIDWSKATTYAPILTMYKDLIALRRNLDGTTRGLTGSNVNIFHVNDGAKVIAFHRWANGGPGDDVIVIANFSATAFPAYDIGLPRSGTWKVRFNGDATVYGADFNATAAGDVTAWNGAMHGLPYHGTTAVGPYSVTILSQ